jgi:hypothetical protein
MNDAVEMATDEYGVRWRVDIPLSRHGRAAVVRTAWIVRVGDDAPVPNVLDRMMSDQDAHLSLLDVVALLADRPADRLVRGQVGTVVEQLDGGAVLVEFCDDRGRAYAIVPCRRAEILVLRYVPQAA